MKWKCAQKFWIIFKDNLLSSSAKNYTVVQEEGISAECLIGYISIFLMEQDAKRDIQKMDMRHSTHFLKELASGIVTLASVTAV